MAPSEPIYTTDQTLNALREKAKDADDFVIKILRRAHPGASPMLMASLSGAQVQHFISPELWIPQLLGGGKFSLQGYHGSDMGRAVGGFVQTEINEPLREVDPTVIEKVGWRGPTTLDFPKKEARRQQEDMPAYSVHSPPGPDSGINATSNSQPWVRSPGGGVHRQDYGNNGWQANSQQLAQLEAERRKLELDKLEAERHKHRDELESIKKSHEADMRALKTEMLSAINSQRPPDNSAANMLAEMMKQAAEDRRAAENRAADDRRAEAARQERADARFADLLAKMSEKPKDNTLDMVKAVVELVGGKKGDNGTIETQAKMMHTMTEMMSQQAGVTMDIIATAADMQLGAAGEKEPGWVKGLESVVKTFGAMAKGATARRPPPPQMQQPQLPQTYEQQARQPAQPGQPPPQAQQHQKAPPVIDQVEMAIRIKTNPVEVAKALVEHFQDPSIQQALMESKGDIEGYVLKRLGNWVNEDAVNNPAYLKVLFEEIEKQFMAAGFIAPDQEDEEPEDAQITEPEEEAE